MRRTKIYVAGPITLNNPIHNTHKAIVMGHKLWESGYAPYIPHTDILMDLVKPLDYDTWMEFDYEWLIACDVLLRIPGASKGADKEVEWAKERGMPVFYHIEELLAQCPPKRE